MKAAIGMMVYDFHDLKTITFDRVADIADFWLEIIQFFFRSVYNLTPVLKYSWKLEKSKVGNILKF